MKSQTMKSLNILFFLFGMALLTSMAAMELFSGTLALFGIFYLFKKKHDTPKIFGPETYLLVLFALISIFSLIHGDASHRVLKTLFWFRWIPIFYLISFCLTLSREATSYFLFGLGSGAALSFLNGLFQFFTGWDIVRSKIIEFGTDDGSTRITSFFNLPTTYAYSLSMFLFLALGLSLSQKNPKNRNLWIAASLLCLVAIILTMTRGAWVAVLISGLIFFFLTKRKWILPLVVSVTALFVSLWTAHSGLRERINSFTDFKYYSNLQRIELWKANLLLFRENPILGVGLHENDHLVEQAHMTLGHSTDAIVSHAHNMYLQYLVGLGGPGFLIFLGILIFFLFLTKESYFHTPHSQRPLFIGLLCAQLAFMISGLVDCNFRDAEVRYMYLAVLALLVSQRALFSKGSLGEARFESPNLNRF